MHSPQATQESPRPLRIPQQQLQQLQQPPLESGPQEEAPQPPRFEDLTIDDDMPLLPRLQRYVQSSIALQRLVHVRMLGEVAIELGPQLTAQELVPMLPPLVKDGESIIRQRVCAELRLMGLVLMGMLGENGPPDAQEEESIRAPLACLPAPNRASKYYKLLLHQIFPHLHTLIADTDNEVRRAACETIVKLALRVHPEDVAAFILDIPLRLIKEGKKRAATSAPTNDNDNLQPQTLKSDTQTPAEELLITASSLLANLSAFLPPSRLPPPLTTYCVSPAILSLSEDLNFRVRRAAVQALPRVIGSATLEDVKHRLMPKFLILSGDEMYRVRKACSECLVDVSRALGILGWRIHFRDVWSGTMEEKHHTEYSPSTDNSSSNAFFKLRTKKQIADLHNTLRECHEIRRRALCDIAKKLLEDTNKFVRYGMMQFLGPLIASFYPLDRGSMVGAMGGLTFSSDSNRDMCGSGSRNVGVIGIGAESIGIAKSATGLERVHSEIPAETISASEYRSMEDIMSYNHSLHGLELILHGESPINRAILGLSGGSSDTVSHFGTMGPQFFPHANGMVGRSSTLDDDDTDALLLSAKLKKQNVTASHADSSTSDPRVLLPKFILESRSDALALSRIILHRNGCIPNADAHSSPLPYPPLMLGRPDPDDLKSIRSSLLSPFLAMASCLTGEESTDAEMRVYCAYSLPAVVLLLGGTNWERDGLKKCFLDLICRSSSTLRGEDQMDKEEEVEIRQSQPPLPVKRCLASSIHAIAHMLGPEVVSKDVDFLASFEHSFLMDQDEAIRLNILKNCAGFLAALPPGNGEGHRNHFLPVINFLIMGEDLLGAAKKRSASNPGVLNWRQRDAVAKVLPDIIVLYNASLNREFIWPILKALLSDSVSAVRENAGWSVPVLLRKYINAVGEKDANLWISEVISWLKEMLLGECFGKSQTKKTSFRRSQKQMVASEGAFSKRQGYCRICAAVALAMRIGESERYQKLVSDTKSKTRVGDGMIVTPIDPFCKLSPFERDHFRAILLNDLLPAALEMTVDCVANVRLTLTKCLKVMPSDIREESHVEEVLETLEEELMTWDVGDMSLNDVNLASGGTMEPSLSITAGGIMTVSSEDPPEVIHSTKEIMMTSTMSAC